MACFWRGFSCKDPRCQKLRKAEDSCLLAFRLQLWLRNIAHSELPWWSEHRGSDHSILMIIRWSLSRQTNKQFLIFLPKLQQPLLVPTNITTVYYQPPLTFLHFWLKSFPTFYSLVRSVLNWPRQPNSAAIRSLKICKSFLSENKYIP